MSDLVTVRLYASMHTWSVDACGPAFLCMINTHEHQSSLACLQDMTTALLLAAEYGRDEMLAVLIKSGAVVQAQTQVGSYGPIIILLCALC